MNEKAETLVRYRQLLLDNGKYRPSVSRSYYAMFYSVLALLVKKAVRISKHTGAVSVFNREFVKKGIFDKELSLWLQEAFDMRQRADYRELFVVSPERAQQILSQARTFVAQIKTAISKDNQSVSP